MKSEQLYLQYCATTSTTMASTENLRANAKLNTPPLFNPKDCKQKERLQLWCHEVWLPTFVRSLQSGNAMFFHSCCYGFSRRAFCRLAGHPELQTCRLSKMPSFRDVSSAMDLYHWLLGLLTEDTKRGLTVYFPAINRVHYEAGDHDEFERADDLESLRKRVEQLTVQEKKLAEHVKVLKTENEKLLLSSKTWYLKYQDMLERTDHHPPSAFTTPVQKRSKSNFECFDEIF